MRLKFFQPGFPIQISPDLWIFAPPRSFSQLITSFIGSQCQGIHPTLFILNQRCLSFDKLLRFEVIALTSFLRFFSLRLQHLRVAPRMSCHCYDFFVFLCVVFNVLLTDLISHHIYLLWYIWLLIMCLFLLIWQPPTFPYRHQHSIIGRLSLNNRVRDVYGCFP